jgi:hypothetical protein
LTPSESAAEGFADGAQAETPWVFHNTNVEIGTRAIAMTVMYDRLFVKPLRCPSETKIQSFFEPAEYVGTFHPKRLRSEREREATDAIDVRPTSSRRFR